MSKQRSVSCWHFLDYPKSEDKVLIKTTDGDFLIAEWDFDHNRWLDVGRDYAWFTGGVACWAYICDFGIPETTKPMPVVR